MRAENAILPHVLLVFLRNRKCKPLSFLAEFLGNMYEWPLRAFCQYYLPAFSILYVDIAMQKKEGQYYASLLG